MRHVVADQHDGDAARPHVQDQIQHAAAFLDAKRCRRFVQDDDAAAEGRGAGDGNALAPTDFGNDMFSVAHYGLPALDPLTIETPPSTVGTWVFGTDGADTMLGAGGTDMIQAGAGNDTVSAGAGNDSVQGGDGNDLLRGGSGNDLLQGQAGQDSLFGDEGNDSLLGGAGNDLLQGGAGSDLLAGGAGADMLWGGAERAQRDVFVFNSPGESRLGALRDRIGDFRPGTDFLEIKADLNGNGLKSASQVLGTATTDADSNAVLHLGGGVEIVLIGVHASDLKADMIHMN